MDFTLVGVLPKCGYQFGCWYGTAHLNKALGTYPTPAVPIRPFPEIRSDFEAWLREQTAPFKKVSSLPLEFLYSPFRLDFRTL